jgi:hypothetical protein
VLLVAGGLTVGSCFHSCLFCAVVHGCKGLAPLFLCVVMPISCCGGRLLFVGGWSGQGVCTGDCRHMG